MNKIFKIEGMTCASCSLIIEENVKTLAGVDSIQVNFATEKAEISYQKNFNEAVFLELMIKLGYRAVSMDQVANPEDHFFFNTLFYQSLIAVVVGLISMALSMGPASKILSHETNNIVQFIGATLILVFFAKKYFLAVIHFIKTGYANMNTLIGMGVGSAYLYSLGLMILSLHSHVYFETIPFIIGFTMFGHFLEDKAKTKARSTLSSLYKMQIKFASKIVDGAEINTPVIELKVGDIIRLKPGDKIPLDGEVIDGTTHADESMITGESIAVVKNIGDKVFAGSLNLEGSVKVSVKEELHQTYISEVVAFVEKAQLKKAPIQKIADKIVQYFVPLIIVIALITFGIWWFFNSENKSYEAFSHMIAVLLIACPCALGLAVPMAVLLGTTEASKRGLLIGGGDVIEKGSSIDVVVFDKTGTLTIGQPAVVDFSTNINEEDFFKIVGSVSQYSNHPLSKAITKFIEKKNIKISDPDKFKNLPGLGFESVFEGKKILVGKRELLESENIKISVSASVGSLVYIGIDNQYVGQFVIADPLKKEAKKTIVDLKNLGLEVWMLTGDNQQVADKIASEIGILNVMANVLPVDKAGFLKKLQAEGKKVAMIGDGINDAPALATANLSMAMSGGSDIAVDASEVSILEGKIECVSYFFAISKRTMRIIKQNLFLSFFYNLLCIPLAAGVFYPFYHISLTPMWASLAMGLSSLSVILSSLRLKKSI